MKPIPAPFKDVQEAQCDLAAPSAAPMCESLRAFGYDLSSAIADLIDNSIFAKAKSVWVDFIWDGTASKISITDDGDGMSESVLLNAMRPGSRNPLEPRHPDDLGRYGLGLKTASFSQCRRLIVRSKVRGGATATRCWDLDFVSQKNKWLLLREAPTSSETHFERLSSLRHGTTVLWEVMDRVVGDQDVDNDTHRRFFHNRIELVEQHLAMVFHRYLGPPKRLKILVNSNQVQAWDPFLKSEPATQQIADEERFHYQHKVRVVPYVLPHISKLGAKQHQAASGPKGWNQQQGFYVYRNQRLLVAGDWLGLPFAKEEHFKLARIQLDIPNAMDDEWEIDVTKSKAHPPDSLRAYLRGVADQTRRRASEVYRHRGRVLARRSSQDFVFVWQQVKRRGLFFHRINRDHPMVADAIARDKALVEPLLRLAEETIPVPLVTITNAEQPDSHSPPFDGASSKEIGALLERIYNVMLQARVNPQVAVARLRVMEPFDRFPELVAAFEERLSSVDD